MSMQEETLRLRLHTDLLEQLKILADSNALSMSAQVRLLIKKAIREKQ